MSNEIKFGTDGWRGIIAGDFTFANVRACAQSIASYLLETRLADKGFLIGYDTRFASEDFAAAAAEVLAGNGIKVHLCSGPSPTPVISYGITSLKTAGAIIITASHNPARWNGLKLKTLDGTSAPQETTDKLENQIPDILARNAVKAIPLAQGTKSGIIALTDLAPVYTRQVESLLDQKVIRDAKLTVAADYMFGAAAGYFKTFIGGSRLNLLEINAERNPSFPGMAQPEPIARNLVALQKAVLENKADVGIATDGDGDRVGIMDEKGTFLNQLQVFALLALYLLEVRGMRGPIVKTVTASNMLYRLGELYGVPVLETAVGFKYVAPLMISENALIGGEESGGYGFRGHVPERDGILAGLYFLDLMVRTGKLPSRLLEYLYSKVGPHHYVRSDVTFPSAGREKIVQRLSAAKPASIAGRKLEKTDTIDGFRFMLAGGSWLLIRFSGTEPLLRIYAEAESPEAAEKLVNAGKNLAGV